MSFLSFLKSTNPKQTKDLNDTIAKLEKKSKAPEYKPTYEFMPKPEPAAVQHYVPTMKVIDMAGNVIDLPYDSILDDDLCLVSDDSFLYHTYVGCGIRCDGMFKMSIIADAKKAGKIQCESCWNAINRIRKEIETEESWDGDDD